MTTEKAKGYLIKKGELAQICAETYPNDTATKIVIDTSWFFEPLTDSITVDSMQVGDKFYYYTTIHKHTKETRTITNTVTQTVRDSAREKAWQEATAKLTRELIVKETQLQMTKEQRDGWIKNAIWSIAGNLLLLLLLLRKPISKILNPVTSWLKK